MSFITLRKSLGFAAIALAMASFCVAGAAADNAVEIDRQLDATATELSKELDQANRQFHEAQRLGQPNTVANQYGSSGAIERNIDATVRVANDELARSQKVIDYQEKRQEIMTNRSQYYPGTADYNRLTSDINNLDRDYSEGKTIQWP